MVWRAHEAKLFNRLSKIDLPGRLSGKAPRLFTQIVVAAGLLIVVLLVRRGIDLVAPGTIPFSLLFPAVLGATLVAGWESGVIVMGLGGSYAWLALMPQPPPGAARPPAEFMSGALFFLCAGAMIAFAEAHRSIARAMVRGQAELRESEERLDLAARAGAVGVWDWRLTTGEMIYSDEAKRICGFSLDTRVTYEMVVAVTHPEDFPRTSAQAARALDPAIRDSSPFEYRIVTPAGEERWVVANGRAVFETLDGETVATRYVGTLQDITAAKIAEQERAEAAATLRLALGAGRMAIWQARRGGGLTKNPGISAMFGLPEDVDLTGEAVSALYMPGEGERLRQSARHALAVGERFFEAEFRIRRSDGAMRWLMVRAELDTNPDGEAEGALGVLMDVTERKNAEERLHMLAREVDHRANNLLAVVQGTVQLSHAQSAEALKEVLVGRISALGRAHQLLSEARWEGADLRRLVVEELLAFSLGEATRVTVEGPDVALSPAAAQGLAMALHELATNATKYGALSVPTGQVTVAWTRLDHGPLRLTWTETGGPWVSKPSRQGLGTTMLARALGGTLGGSSRMDWRPEGLVCELMVPGEALETASV